MARVSPLMLLPPALFAGLALAFYLGMQREDPQALPSAREGQIAPPVELEPLRGEGFGHDELTSGGMKVVNFWASWCAPCRAEHPNLEELAAEGVPIYGINYKDEPGKAVKFLDDLGDPFVATVADTEGRVGIDWGLYGVPETYVLDGEGRIVLRFAGPITDRVIDKTIRPAIEKARH